MTEHHQRKFEGIWIPANIWLSKDLTLQEKVFLVEIKSLDNDKGCFASNKYFAEHFQLSKSRCSEVINSLKEKGLIDVRIIKKEGSEEVERRIIKVNYAHELFKEGIRKIEGGYSENRRGVFDIPKENNTLSNNTSLNNKKNMSSKELDSIPYKEIIDYLNQKANTNYRHTTKKTRQLIQTRWKEDFKLEDFKKVIDNKTTQWLNDPKMNKYLRPETLFGTKFESYLNERVVTDGRNQRVTGQTRSTVNLGF